MVALLVKMEAVHGTAPITTCLYRLCTVSLSVTTVPVTIDEQGSAAISNAIESSCTNSNVQVSTANYIVLVDPYTIVVAHHFANRVAANVLRAVVEVAVEHDKAG